MKYFLTKQHIEKIYPDLLNDDKIENPEIVKKIKLADDHL